MKSILIPKSQYLVLNEFALQGKMFHISGGVIKLPPTKNGHVNESTLVHDVYADIKCFGLRNDICDEADAVLINGEEISVNTKHGVYMLIDLQDTLCNPFLYLRKDAEAGMEFDVWTNTQNLINPTIKAVFF